LFARRTAERLSEVEIALKIYLVQQPAPWVIVGEHQIALVGDRVEVSLVTVADTRQTRLPVLLVVTDDFPGLEPLLRSLLPGSDHQLCTVHLLRNARRHLSPTDYETFHQTWQDICSSSSFDTAREKWQTLLLFLTPDYSSYAQHLESRTQAYLTFMHYPRAARPNLRTTNLPEGLNNLIENLRRNSGGHFHSEREVKIKMKILFDQLYRSKWAKPHPTLVSYLQQLTQAFRKRFEQELPPLSFLTTNSYALWISRNTSNKVLTHHELRSRSSMKQNQEIAQFGTSLRS